MTPSARGRTRALCVLLALSGCNQILGVAPHHRSDAGADATSDAPFSDGATEKAPIDGDDGSVESVDAAGGGDAQADVGSACTNVVVDPSATGLETVDWALYLVPTADLPARLNDLWGPLHEDVSDVNVPNPGGRVTRYLPVAPHAPPYDHELSDALRAAGIGTTACIEKSDLTTTTDVVLSFVLLAPPGGPSHRSVELPDVATPTFDGKFPTHADLYRDGKLIDGTFTATIYPQGQDNALTKHLGVNLRLMTLSPSIIDQRGGDYEVRVRILSSLYDPNDVTHQTTRTVHFSVR